jgi:hypothetical protein
MSAFLFFPENLLAALGCRTSRPIDPWRAIRSTSRSPFAGPELAERLGASSPDGPPPPPRRSGRRRAAEALLLLLCFAAGYRTATALRRIGGAERDPAVRLSALLPPR